MPCRTALSSPEAPIHASNVALIDGCERWVSGEADGTPRIGEFIAAEIGASPASAMMQIAQVLNVRHRHPSCGRPSSPAACGSTRPAGSRTPALRRLSAQACLWLDQQCAVARRVQPWARVRGNIDGWILMADPRLASERAARAAEVRNMGVGRLVDGHCDVSGHHGAADGNAFDQALTTVAATLTDDDATEGGPEATSVGRAAQTRASLDRRRAAAFDWTNQNPAGSPGRPVTDAPMPVTPADTLRIGRPPPYRHE